MTDPPIATPPPPSHKGDITYGEWKYETQSLINDPEIKETKIIQSIRYLRLGEKSTVIEILDKLIFLFREVTNNGMIMQGFFNTYQCVQHY